MVAFVSPARAVYDRLSASGDLLAIAVGGVWDRPLERRGPKATLGAFDPDKGTQRPAVVIPDDGEEADTSGPDGAFFGFPTVWFYADDDPIGVGRAAIEQAVAVVRTTLDGWDFTTASGTGVGLRMAGRFGVRSDPTDETRLMDYVRLQADGLW